MRKFKNYSRFVKVYAGIGVSISFLFGILLYTLANGLRHISFEFLQTIIPVVVTTLMIVFLTLLIAVPIGIGSAIYLNEYAKPGRFVTLIRMAIETLSGIPSIIYGLFGFLFYVMTLRWTLSILAGICTVAIMMLPIIIRSSEEALKAVPISYREGSFALGAGKFFTIMRTVLPSAIPGILASIILTIGRIVGETAALIYTAGTLVAMPTSLFSSSSTLAVFMYTSTVEGTNMNRAYATAVVLLALILFLNSLANYIAKKLKKG
ncbi:MAG: phosphate ABC transporter permease PstA [Clostridiales bacterium]|jgi:phosphate transport system permease protein|nr:phosphate ABC transporter permease PstA [Clostridiales bacterium]